MLQFEHGVLSMAHIQELELVPAAVRRAGYGQEEETKKKKKKHEKVEEESLDIK